MLTLLVALMLGADIVTKPLPAKSHYGLRDTTENYIVIHNDGENAGVATTFTTLRRRHAGYHYFVSRAGKIYQFIDLKYAANHAGRSLLWGMTQWNNFSIAICLQGKSTAGYNNKQYASLNRLITMIHLRYPDSILHPIVGHQTVAYPRGRKNDPGPYFDFTRIKG